MWLMRYSFSKCGLEAGLPGRSYAYNLAWTLVLAPAFVNEKYAQS
jgi:hypothetical protein